MKEYQIVVLKDLGNHYWYTAQVRKIYFLFRSGWKDLLPANQPSYEKANLLITNKLQRIKQ